MGTHVMSLKVNFLRSAHFFFFFNLKMEKNPINNVDVLKMELLATSVLHQVDTIFIQFPMVKTNKYINQNRRVNQKKSSIIKN